MSSYCIDAEKQDHPDAEHIYFVWDVNEGFSFFKCPDRRDLHAEQLILSYADVSDGWGPDVEQILTGEITETVRAVNVKPRPPAEEINEHGEDPDGVYWPDGFAKLCDYQLKSINEDANNG